MAGKAGLLAIGVYSQRCIQAFFQWLTVAVWMRIFLSVFPCGRRSFDADKLKNAVFKFTRRSVDAVWKYIS